MKLWFLLACSVAATYGLPTSENTENAREKRAFSFPDPNYLQNGFYDMLGGYTNLISDKKVDKLASRCLDNKCAPFFTSMPGFPRFSACLPGQCYNRLCNVNIATGLQDCVNYAPQNQYPSFQPLLDLANRFQAAFNPPAQNVYPADRRYKRAAKRGNEHGQQGQSQQNYHEQPNQGGQHDSSKPQNQHGQGQQGQHPQQGQGQQGQQNQGHPGQQNQGYPGQQNQGYYPQNQWNNGWTFPTFPLLQFPQFPQYPINSNLDNRFGEIDEADISSTHALNSFVCDSSGCVYKECLNGKCTEKKCDIDKKNCVEVVKEPKPEDKKKD